MERESCRLSLDYAGALGQIIGACERNAKVGYMYEDQGGDVRVGTMRSIGTEDGNFAGAQDDVRDMFVRITMTTGWEYFMPVGEAVAKYRDTTLVLDYESVPPKPAVHKARKSADPYICAVCQADVKTVPGGSGLVLIHTHTGTVAGPGEDKS